MKMKQDKSSNKPPGGRDQKVVVNVKDALCSLVMRSPTKEWGELPPLGLMFCQTSSQEVRQTKSINNSARKGYDIIMHVGNTILAAAAEAEIDESWCLLDNQSTCNEFINGKYLSNIIDDPYGKYLRVHCNAGVRHTNKIGDLPEYSYPVWYNPKGIANILYLGLVQKNHHVTYNSQDGNKFVIKTILDKYKEVIICCCLIYINGIGFLKTISPHIKFATGSMIKSEKFSTFQIESHRYINYTYSAVSISHTCTLILSFTYYASK